MNEKDIIIDELKDEISGLKSRNRRLSVQISTLTAEIAEMEEEIARLKQELSMRGAKSGRKVHDASWRLSYDRVTDGIDKGERPKDTIKRLGMGRSTYYRYRNYYLQEQAKEKEQ